MADNSLGSKTGHPIVLPVITGPTAWTPSVAAVSAPVSNVWYVRRGNMMKGWGTISFGVVSGSIFAIPLPSGTTVDGSYVINGKTKFGSGHTQGSGVGAVWANGTGLVIIADSTQGLGSLYADYQSNLQGALPFTPRTGTALFNNTNTFNFEFEVPIAEWSGSVNIPYGSGSGGLTPSEVAAVPATLVNGISYQVSPVASMTGTLPVTSLACTIDINDASGGCSTTNFIRVTPGSGDKINGYTTADSLVLRRRNVSVRLSKAAGSTTWYVTYQAATTSSPPGQVPGYIGSTPIGIGFVGETVESYTANVNHSAASGVPQDITSIVLTQGKWRLDMVVLFSSNASNVGTRMQAFIGSAPGNSFAGQLVGSNNFDENRNTSNTNIYGTVPGVIVTVGSGGQTYYAKVFIAYTTLGGVQNSARLTATRIA